MATEREETKARRARRWGWIALGAAAVALVAAGLVLQSGLLGPRGGEGEKNAGQTGPGAGGVAADRLAQAVAQFNRAAALLEQYDYSKAAKAFERVVEQFPDWTAARFDLGLAYFNARTRESTEKARQAFEEVLHADPNNLHARYCLGLCCQYLGQSAQALASFEAVHQRDPNDPHAAYKYAEALSNLDRKPEAMPVLERLVASDPGFVSGVYRLAALYQQTGQREKAAGLRARFEQLDKAELVGHSYVVEPIYGAAGKYSMALQADSLPLPRSEEVRATRVLFSPVVKRLDLRMSAWKWAGGEVTVPGIAVGDLNGDGSLDLVLAGAAPEGSASIWWNDGKGNFSSGPRVADKVVSPCLGDVNNDGQLDLWLGRAGEDLLLLNDGKGNFTRVSYGASGGDSQLTACARVADVDSDGDLDLLSLRRRGGSVPGGGQPVPAASALYRNNRDGTFTEMATRLGLAFSEVVPAAVVFDDFDNDRDLDLHRLPREREADRLGQRPRGQVPPAQCGGHRAGR